MAYREVDMWEILNVLQRIGRGEQISAISRVTGHSRTTVRRYVAVARQLGWQRGLEEPSEELAAQVAEDLGPLPRSRVPGEVERQLLPHRGKIRAWLSSVILYCPSAVIENSLPPRLREEEGRDVGVTEMQ